MKLPLSVYLFTLFLSEALCCHAVASLIPVINGRKHIKGLTAVTIVMFMSFRRVVVTFVCPSQFLLAATGKRTHAVAGWIYGFNALKTSR